MNENDSFQAAKEAVRLYLAGQSDAARELTYQARGRDQYWYSVYAGVLIAEVVHWHAEWGRACRKAERAAEAHQADMPMIASCERWLQPCPDCGLWWPEHRLTYAGRQIRCEDCQERHEARDAEDALNERGKAISKGFE